RRIASERDRRGDRGDERVEFIEEGAVGESRSSSLNSRLRGTDESSGSLARSRRLQVQIIPLRNTRRALGSRAIKQNRTRIVTDHLVQMRANRIQPVMPA